MTELLQATLSQLQIEAVLRVAGVDVGPGSPLPHADAARPASRAVLDTLRDNGLTDQQGRLKAAWMLPITALANPRARLHVRLGGARETAAQYYVAHDTIVAVAAAGDDGHTLSSPHNIAEILGAIAGWMGTAGLPQSPSFSDTLTGAEFTALVALVDAYREERLRAFIERRPAGEDGFAGQMLERQVAAADAGDTRWLAGVVARYGPGGIRLDGRLDEGLASLQRRGWISVDEGDVTPLEPVVSICESLANTMPCMSCAADSAVVASSILALRGADAFWAFEESGEEPPCVHVAALNGSELERVFERQFAAVLRHAEAPDPVPEPHDVADTSPAASRRGAQGASPCTSCGAAQMPGARFCPDCGTRIGEQPASAVSFCTECGERLGQGLRFCTACGTPAGASAQG